MCVELRDVIGMSAALMMAMVFLVMAAIPLIRRVRRTSQSRLLAFVVGACIATAAAQKVKYVDANAVGANTGEDWENAYTNLQTAVRALTGIYDAGEIYVKPGTYGPICVDGDWLKYSLLLDPNTTIIGVEGPEKTIIDGGGVTNCYQNVNDAEIWMFFEGLSFINGKFGLKGGQSDSLHNCIVSNCEVGVDGIPWIRQSLIVKNTKLGACLPPHKWGPGRLSDSTVSDNGIGFQGSADVDCDHTIIWGNGIDCAECENPYALGDPLFVDAEHGDYHLKMGSPCILTGSSSGDGFDLDGLPRVARGAQDYGCYEYQPTNDIQTITVPIPVEFSWLDQYCAASVAAAGGDYDAAVKGLSSNLVTAADGTVSYRPLWESYLIGLDPNDTNAQWHATIAVTNGVPTIGSDPWLRNRRYTVLGKHSLTDAVWSAESEAPRFFKVKVELP